MAPERILCNFSLPKYEKHCIVRSTIDASDLINFSQMYANLKCQDFHSEGWNETCNDTIFAAAMSSNLDATMIEDRGLLNTIAQLLEVSILSHSP